MHKIILLIITIISITAYSDSIDPNQLRMDRLDVTSNDMIYGNADSKILFIEYFSPTCPHCAYFKKNIFPEIKKKYIDTGIIKYVIREFIGNKLDLEAGLLARCAGNSENYLKFISVILEQQDKWAFSSKYRDLLTNIGQLGGISPPQYLTCLNDDKLSELLINNTKIVAKYPGFTGTPAFFIQGRQYKDRYSFEAISSAIEKAISEQPHNG